MSNDDELDLAALQQSLSALAQWETEMGDIERDLEIHRIRKTHLHYSRRSEIVKGIPKFWYIVFAENDDLADYVSPDDLRFLESIQSIDVSYPIASRPEPLTQDDYDHCKDFAITFAFGGDSTVPLQVVTKHFYLQLSNGEEIIVSDPVDVQWPAELELVNPLRIKAEKQPLTSKLKKDYRAGMKSFFAWFAWTGKKPGKEFRNGEDLTRLIADDMYPNALKYYILALPSVESNGEDDYSDVEEDSSEGEPLDLGEDTDEDQTSKKRKLDD